jgi:signal transduction histidine kinase
MLDRVPVRIGLAFAVVGLATLLAVGAGLFVTLRELHRDVTRASMADIAQPLVAKVRLVTVPADLRRRLAELRGELPAEIEVAVLTANGRVLGETEPALDLASIEIDPALVPGEVVAGSLPDAAGTDFLYAATVLTRGGPAAGSRAIVLVTQDRSAAAAWRDVTRVLPVVILLALLLGAPIAWLLSRSITRPLRRLAAATADVPTQGAPPLPLEGPLEVRELIERFNSMTAELDATRREEAELLANVRHDLRTPLTVIGGFAQALEDGTAAGDVAVRAARAIAEEAGRIERLVDGIGTIEEVRTGRLELRPEPLDAGALVAAAIERFAPAAAAAGIELRGEHGRGDSGPPSDDDDPPALSLTADRAAVERILANLVENALAAVPRPGGHVLVDAHRLRDAEGRAAVALRVSDDGRGFPPGTLDRVFDRFYRADAARSGSGSGLGLAIVRALARAHGGEAIAENLAPTGARVTVSLPAIPPRARPSVPPDAVPAAGDP